MTENQQQLVQIALEPAQRQLAAQQAFALASDQRGLVLSGIGVAAAALVSGIEVNICQIPFIKISIIGFLISALFACISAKPQTMFSGGAKYKDMSIIIDEDKPFHDVLAGLGISADEQISKNNKSRFCPVLFYSISIYNFIFSVLIFAIQPILEATNWAKGPTPCA